MALHNRVWIKLQAHACTVKAQTWKDMGSRTVLKPSSCMRYAMVPKSCESAVGPCHSPSTNVEPVSKPNLRARALPSQWHACRLGF